MIYRLISILHITPSSLVRKVIFFMGQAIIVRASGGYNSNGGSGEEEIVGWQEKHVIINTSQLWTVPLAKNNEFSVRIFGGGAGMSAWYNKYIDGKYDQINVNGTVGGGSGYMNNTVVTLNEYDQVQVSIGAGGGTNTAGGTTAFGTYLSATGGEGATHFTALWRSVYGGRGGTGGGCCYFINECAGGGNAIYGGGGGCITEYDNPDTTYATSGRGGTYGGNGYGGSGSIKNGTNTMGNVTLEFTGPGNAGGGYYGNAGGGYGGCGGTNCGGGGGYGANGGNGTSKYSATACGGGGGYGGRGGDGGYDSSGIYGGYGGGYGPENYGRGGGSTNSTLNGKSGCVVITYQAPIYKNAT